MSPDPQSPVVAAVRMGYGHLRPARSIADALGVPVLRADAPPLAGSDDVRSFNRTRGLYEFGSRITQAPVIGRPFLSLMNAVTSIAPLFPERDQSRATRAVKSLDKMIAKGLMRGLTDRLEETGASLITTFYAPAMAADRRGLEHIFCVVTDSDLHRIWAPRNPTTTRIHYLVPSRRAVLRLRAYGVPKANIELTGFPLPEELVGGEDSIIAREHLARRLCRLDPKGLYRREFRALGAPLPEEERGRAPLITFAVGGAGAQIRTVLTYLTGLRDAVAAGKLRVALVAGVHEGVAARFKRAVASLVPDALPSDAVRILFEPDFDGYYRAFNELLAETDILWTKPSELVFYAALGIPLLLSAPIGAQERHNRRYLLERGAGIMQRDPRHAGHWLDELLAEGVLAAAAWSGHTRLPRHGTRRILRSVAGEV
jgi:hypothetical protein